MFKYITTSIIVSKLSGRKLYRNSLRYFLSREIFIKIKKPHIFEPPVFGARYPQYWS